MTRNAAPHVLLVATTTGYQIRSFGEAAQKAGVRLTLASDRCDHLDDPWRDGAVPVRFHDGEGSVRAVAEGVSDDPLTAVLAVGDRPAVLAASIATALGLPGNPPDAAAACRNKLASRRAFREAGLPTPWFRVEPVAVDPVVLASEIAYPVVIKPLALSGSRGVMRADSPEAFLSAFDRLVRLLRSVDVRMEQDAVHDHVLIEAFVPGREFAVEGVLTRGELHLLALFDKPDPLDGPFFEETIYVTPSSAPAAVRGAIESAVATATHALGLVHGPVHAECRVNEEGVYVLEVAARPIGGLCSKALSFVSPEGVSVSLEEMLLQHALGHDVRGYMRESRASGVMMIPIPRRGVYRGVEGIETARVVGGIDNVHITAKADSLLVPLPEGRSYLGFIFAHAATPDAVERSLREAHARLRFTIDRAIDVSSDVSRG
jgi:hypothetical protein